MRFVFFAVYFSLGMAGFAADAGSTSPRQPEVEDAKLSDADAADAADRADPEAVYQSALEYDRRGDRQNARNLAIRAADAVRDATDARAKRYREFSAAMSEKYEKDLLERSAAHLAAGKALLEKGDAAKAREEFEEARSLRHVDFEGHFYAAVAEYRLGNYAAAETAAEWAMEFLRFAPEGQHARVEELYTTIVAHNRSEAAEREGDEAYGKGLMAKAAAAYQRGFEASAKRGDLGLKAATIFADRLDQPLVAAALWRKVVAAGEPHATTALAEIEQHTEALAPLLAKGLARKSTWQTTGNPAEALQLAAAFPDSAELQLEIAALYARKGDIKETTAHLATANQVGIKRADVMSRLELLELLGRNRTGPFATFISDAFGPDAVTSMTSEWDRRTREEQQRARDEAERRRQAALAAEKQKLVAWRATARVRRVSQLNELMSASNRSTTTLVLIEPARGEKWGRGLNLQANFSYTNGVYRIETTRVLYTLLSGGEEHVRYMQKAIYSGRSLAHVRGLSVSPSDWNEGPWGPPPAMKEQCFNLSVGFSQADLRVSRTYTDSENASKGDEGATTSVSFDLLLRDPVSARLIHRLISELVRLDAAGDDVAVLRQVQVDFGN